MDSKNTTPKIVNSDVAANNASGIVSSTADTGIPISTSEAESPESKVDFGANSVPVAQPQNNTVSKVSTNAATIDEESAIKTFDLGSDDSATAAPLPGGSAKVDNSVVQSEAKVANSLPSRKDSTPTPIVHDEIISAPLESHDEAIATGELSTFESTDDISEEGANVLREQAKAKSLQFETLPNLYAGLGINLLPTKTETEIKTEKRKSSFNLFSALAIMSLVSVSIVILGINIVTKMQLNSEKDKLNALENELFAQSEILKKNNDILNRFDLYQDIQESTFSPKEVLLYWEDLITGFGELESIELSNGLQFKVDGQSDSLKEVAFLWHLLTIDEKVSSTNLNSLSKGEERSTFNFEGNLDFEYFVNNTNLTEKEE